MALQITAADVRLAAFGLTIPADNDVDGQIDRLIAKAISRLPGGAAGIQARIDAGTLDEDTVKGVVEDMVIRVLRNPGAVRSTSIDDYSETIDAAVSTGALYISPAELALLALRSQRFFGSVRIGIPSWRVPGA
ncbi:Gp19/Gp15/Gp42 family protein [Phycicoccus sp. 3266]|uniref:Gp19/Gp15/Gp42 family protein n=1 Tax=Phycicoccus sp. 3266 TaxID=2817751 RepID=UPI00285B9693|nr:Gp19/Gp15/Gp42 family protein [Phycicoccus sp. 3266]MDR6861970.1 hypothetical protein [Phycicoccus sp. 3266]